MDHYLNFELYGSNLLLREVKKGVRCKRKVKISPTLYVETKEHTEFKNLKDIYLAPEKFETIKEAKEFKQNYSNNNYPIYGFDRWQYTKIDELYPGETVKFEQNNINVSCIDIETECEGRKYNISHSIQIENNAYETTSTIYEFEQLENKDDYEVYDEELSRWVSYDKSCYAPKGGFPDIEKANEIINAITISKASKYFVLGLKDVDPQLPSDSMYRHFPDEASMLKAFVELWVKLDIDIITGWNIEFFDLPYLYQRILNVLGEEWVLKLSPWGIVSRNKKKVGKKTNFSVKIFGVSVIDYIDIYKKFKLKKQESYKLDHIAFVELGERKLEYEGYLHELYQKDYATFIQYNRRDVYLVNKLEEKLKYIKQCQIIAYYMKVNFQDVYSNVRMWDVRIANYLKEKGIQVAVTSSDDNNDIESDEQYEGAYVKDPIVGFYKWMVSFDLTSLYPSLIRSYNISPDTDINKNITQVFSDLGFMNADSICFDDEQRERISEYLRENNLAMASNGTLYRRDKMGFLAELMGQYFSYRKTAKKKMLQIDKQIQEIDKLLGKNNEI